MRSILLAGACLTLIATIAGATDVAPADFTAVVDLSPLAKTLIEILAAAMLPLITWLVSRYLGPVLIEHLGEQAAQVARDGLNEIIAHGIRLGASKLDARAQGWSIEIQNALVHDAVEHVSKSAPGWVAKFGLDRPRIEDMVRARLGHELRSALDDQADVVAKLKA